MKLKTLTVVGLLLSSGAWAGEGHGHSHGSHGHSHGAGGHSHGEEAIDQGLATNRAKEEIARLIAKGKLDASWSKAEHVSSEKKATKGKTEWLVIYKNDASEKKNLYVFLTPNGKFIAANHTGK